VLGNGRRFKPKVRHNITGAFLAFGNELKYLQPSWVGQRYEGVHCSQYKVFA
jgi:hypothetical protein